MGSQNLKAEYEDRTKLCPLKCLLWQTTFCLGLLSAKQSGTWNFVRFHTFGGPASQLSENSNSFCAQEEGRKQTVPSKDKVLMTRGLLTFMSCNIFWTPGHVLSSFNFFFLEMTN